MSLARRRLLLVVVLLGAFAAGHAISAQRAASSAAAMTLAASQFVASLTAEQRTQAAFALDSAERLRWNFVPTEAFPRSGLLLKDMTEAQRMRAHDLLRSGLSDRGYLTYTQIIELENVLLAIEKGGKFVRDPEGYRVSIFGEPSAAGAWGWRFEGHHISLHFTVVDNRAIASTPSFAGSNPAEVRDGAQKGRRVLGALEDAGRALVTALDDQQRATATIAATAPNEIVTSNTLDIDPLAPDGLKASAMTPAQRGLLTALIEVYATLMETDIAADRLAKIKAAGPDNVAFAWAGPIERGQRHYYRVQGPTFLIEFDNAQNDGNHVHSVWRDFDGDFGRDLLREHLRSAAH